MVPHTFLYYFDANVLPGEAQPPLPPAALQDDWNHAVAKGYPNRTGKKASAPRSSLYFMGGGGGAGPTDEAEDASSPTAVHTTGVNTQMPHPPGGTGTSSEAFATMQPAGIIDLECYTSVHRSAQNQLVLELAGDDAVNPDLRQFYFTAGSETETETWTQALLGQRHTALMDETDAYKQVCDGFAQQLQGLHVDLDDAHKQASDAQEELYAVRSEMEDGRRSCWKMVEEVLDRHQQQNQQDGMASNSTSSSFRADLNAIRSQDMSLLAPVQLLSDYTRVLEDSCQELQTTNATLQAKLDQTVDSDHDQVSQLQAELAEAKAELAQQQSQWAHEKQVLTQNLMKSQKDLEDLNKGLASTRMEITIYQSSTRNKITELQTHRKILKKEVLDLRQKLEDASNELSLVRHKEKSHRLEVGQERKKAELLERYVDKMESQVKVQQNMMEMMSASGMGSVYGGQGAGGSHYEVTVPISVHSPRSTSSYQPSPSRPRTMYNATAGSSNPDVEAAMAESINGGGTVDFNRKDGVAMHDDDDDDAPNIKIATANGSNKNDNKQVVEGLHRLPSPLSRARNMDDDNKSHMSELTEDRTQKQFDAIHYMRETQKRERERNMRYAGSGNTTPSPQGKAPPAYILGSSEPAAVVSGVTGVGSYSQQQNQQQLLQNFQNPDNAKLGTIHSNATAPNHRRVGYSPSMDQHQSRSVSGVNRLTPPDRVMLDNLNNSNHGGQSVCSGASGRLSVAQRARLQADQAGGSTPVRVRLDEEKQKQILQASPRLQEQEQQSGPPVTSPGRGANRGRMERRPSTSSRSTNGGFFSNIGRKLEAAIDKSVFSVDVHHSDDDDDDLSSSASYSRGPDDPIESERYRSDHEDDDVDVQDRHDKNNGRVALLTQETLDGHNCHTQSQHHELLSQSATSPLRKKSSRRSSSGVGGYDDTTSSILSDEKKSATTPDRNRVRYCEIFVCILF